MRTLLSILFLVLFSLPASADVLEVTGNLRTVITDVRESIRQDAYIGSEAFRVPTLAQMSEWRAAVRSVLSGNLFDADRRLSTLAPSYNVVQFSDVTTGRVYTLLVEAVVTDRIVPTIEKGWGTYVFDLDPLRELSIQVPHPIFDSGTELEGMEVFLQLGARSFLLAGTHRCANEAESRCSGTTTACTRPERAAHKKSDVPHNPSNMFHQTHRQLMRSIPNTVAIQLHRNNQAGCPQVLISNTNFDYTAVPDGNVRRLASNFDIPSVGICDPQPGSCNLCGTNNLQGRFSNGSPSPCDTRASSPNEQFIHIEQHRSFFDDFSGNFSPLIDALQRTFP